MKEEFYSHADALVGITTDTTKMQETGALISKVPTIIIAIHIEKLFLKLILLSLDIGHTLANP